MSDADARTRAVEWFVLLASGNATPQERREWAAWHAADPAHQVEWERVERVQRMMSGVPADLASPTLRRPAPRRRQLLKSAAIAGTASVLGYGLWRESDGLGTSAWFADHRTATGEQHRLALADGSVVVMNTATALDVRFDAQARSLRLHEGEIFIETATALGAAGARDPRPLIVDTAVGRVRALGTRFLLRFEDRRLNVAVVDSAVEIRSTRGAVRRLDAGQQVGVDETSIGRTESISGDMTAWTGGSLIVDNARLGDVVAELDRYRRGRLGCDPRVSELRVSGAFPVLDVDRALSALEATLPVRVDRANAYWATVRPRGA
ncbi:FecR domain-containing protein [Mitsuaria sp. 7]|uniref:FecR domain-containing protein n=1 Tax=Mitsuaria sp. 7 TaxID=1658665 RepID=UPI0008356DDB|nr:FecR domain-containing protein [Mitsuaria sp. 7]